jgi:tRNA (guanine37-N1)-methyltransferase
VDINIYRIHIVTIFPELFTSFLETSFIKKSQLLQNNLKVEFVIYNLRDFAFDKHKKVDDEPYGGGCGMILKPEPIFYAIRHIKKNIEKKERIESTRTILLSPQGKIFDQNIAKTFANIDRINNLILICGRYEGFDERVLSIVDEEISIGNFVLNGGELPAMVIAEAVIRLLPGILGNENSYKNDSFYNENNLLDYPQFTRPSNFENLEVPEILLSGDHKKIKEWRKEQAFLNTHKKRPDLKKPKN